MIFLDTNVISETLRKTPNPAVIAWLVRNDAELALPRNSSPAFRYPALLR